MSRQYQNIAGGKISINGMACTLSGSVPPTPAAPTSKSPAPLAGLIAGLGIAGIVLTRLRK